jgi:hypothetical protein
MSDRASPTPFVAPAVTGRATEASWRLKARIAGALYLFIVIGGLFSESVVMGPLTVAGDAAATAQAIAANGPLWRWGLAVHLLYLLAAVPLAVIFYELFKPVQATLARCALIFSLMGPSVEATSLLQLYLPLAVAGHGGALGGLSESQRQALAYLGIRLFSTGFGFALLFFSGFCVLAGMLILRSRVVPRLIGAMMILAGVCYFVNSLTLIVAPALANLLFPWILVPCLLAELSLALWLLVMGVDVKAVG